MRFENCKINLEINPKHKTENKISYKFENILFAIIIVIVIALTLSFSVFGLNSSSVEFSEIMFNPQGSDTGREWIEFSNPLRINFSECRLFESGTNHHVLEFYNSENINNNYSIICDDCNLFISEYNLNWSNKSVSNSSSLNFTIYESSFSLSNSGEEISLICNNSNISINYSSQNISEGYSVEIFNGTQRMSIVLGGTPGYAIFENMTEINSTINVTTNETINETLNQTVNNTINQTINDTNNSTINITTNNTESCFINLSIHTIDNLTFYNNGEQVKFRNKINSSEKINFTIQYWIEDLDNVIKKPINTTNLDLKTYTPNIDSRIQMMTIHSKIVSVSCSVSQDSIINANYSFFVINNAYVAATCPVCAKDKQSSSKSSSYTPPVQKCDIPQDILDKNNLNNSILLNNVSLIIDKNKNAFLDVDLKISRGSDRKYLVELYAVDNDNRKISTVYKFHMGKESSFDASILLPLKECVNGVFIIEGMNISIEREFECNFENNNTNSFSMQKNETTKIADLGSKIIKEYNTTSKNEKSEISGMIVYESKNMKNKEYSVYGIILAVLLAGFLVFKYYFGRSSHTTETI